MCKYIIINILSIAIIGSSTAIVYVGILENQIIYKLSLAVAALFIYLMLYILKKGLPQIGLYSINNFYITNELGMLLCWLPFELYIGNTSIETIVDFNTNWGIVFFNIMTLFVYLCIFLDFSTRLKGRPLISFINFKIQEPAFYIRVISVVLFFISGICMNLAFSFFLFGLGFVPLFCFWGIILYIAATLIILQFLPYLWKSKTIKNNYQDRLWCIMAGDVWLALNLLSCVFFMFKNMSIADFQASKYHEVVFVTFLLFFIICSIASYIVHSIIVYKKISNNMKK